VTEPLVTTPGGAAHPTNVFYSFLNTFEKPPIFQKSFVSSPTPDTSATYNISFFQDDFAVTDENQTENGLVLVVSSFIRPTALTKVTASFTSAACDQARK
jgi:hypothetical protein